MTKITKTPTANMTREEWLAERRKSVGGSEAGAVLGLSEWASPYSVWADKRGLLPDKGDNEAMRIGRDLEDYVAQRFTEASGIKVRKDQYIYRNDDYPFLHANIDRRCVGVKAGLECKTASALTTKRFHLGEFPDQYYAQCVSYMAVTGLPTWYLAVLVMGKSFKVYGLTVDAEAENPDWCEDLAVVDIMEFATLREEIIHFWARVEANVPPSADGKDCTSAAIDAVNGRETLPDVVDLMPFAADLGEIADIDDKIKALNLRRETLVQGVKLHMGGHECGACGDHRITWKPQTRHVFDREAFAADHPEINLEKYQKATVCRPFRIY